MDAKVIGAFLVGAVVASGIVYMSVRPVEVARPGQVAGVDQRQTATAGPPAVVDAPEPARVEVPAPVPVEAPPPVAPKRLAQAPVREKPSPMPPPVRRELPAVARIQVPPSPPPVPAPEESHPVEARPVEPPPAPVMAAPAPAAIAPEPPPPAPSVPEPEGPVPHTVTLEAGTYLPVRIGETISSARNQVGDSFLATLDQPLVLDGFIIAERGSRVEGRVIELEPAGRTRGVSHVGIELVRLSTSDGQRIRIRTEPYKKDGQTSAGNDAAKIGVGAAIGAAIGAIAGGGKGAAIGAGAGGAAGVGDVLLTRGKPAEIPVETRLTFRVQDPVTITERLN